MKTSLVELIARIYRNNETSAYETLVQCLLDILRRELVRRDLTFLSPKVLGVSTGTSLDSQAALRELSCSVLADVIVLRQEYWLACIDLPDTMQVERMIFASIRNWLFARQRSHNKESYAAYRLLKSTLAAAVDAEELRSSDVPLTLQSQLRLPEAPADVPLSTVIELREALVRGSFLREFVGYASEHERYPQKGFPNRAAFIEMLRGSRCQVFTMRAVLSAVSGQAAHLWRSFSGAAAHTTAGGLDDLLAVSAPLEFERVAVLKKVVADACGREERAQLMRVLAELELRVTTGQNTSLRELANTLDIPRSTLHLRMRRLRELAADAFPG